MVEGMKVPRLRSRVGCFVGDLVLNGAAVTASRTAQADCHVICTSKESGGSCGAGLVLYDFSLKMTRC